MESNSELFNKIKERLVKGDVNFIVIASRNGKSAINLAEKIPGVKIVSVTEFTYDDDAKKTMKRMNINYIEKTDLPIQDNRALKDALMLLGSGVKSAFEVVTIAKDKGLIDGNGISIAGSKRGLDTALFVKPVTSSEMLNSDPKKITQLLEIIKFPVSKK